MTTRRKQPNPPCTPTLSAELRAAICEKNILTTRSRMKLIRAIDSMVVDLKEEKRVNNRQNAVKEVYTSELSYLQQLEAIMQFFIEPVQQLHLTVPPSISSLFDNIETLYKINGELLQELKKSSENIGTAFLKLAPFLKLYSVYAYDYKQALISLQDLNKTYGEFHEFISKQATRPEVGTTLSSLLITPIQRIPRYRLLLKELLTYTKQTDPQYVIISDALLKVEEAALHIDRLILEYEHTEKMIALVKRFSGNKPDIIKPGRKILKEGSVMKVTKNGRTSHSRYMILFTDSLMLCKGQERGSLTLSYTFSLKNCLIEPVMSTGVFRVSSSDDSVLLYTANSLQGSEWIKALETAIKQHEDSRQTLRKESSKRRTIRRPGLLKKSSKSMSPSPKKVGCLKIMFNKNLL